MRKALTADWRFPVGVCSAAQLDNVVLARALAPGELVVKLHCFEFSTYTIWEGPRVESSSGTALYMAPEVLTVVAERYNALAPTAYDATKADVWALGVCALSMLLGRCVGGLLGSLAAPTRVFNACATRSYPVSFPHAHMEHSPDAFIPLKHTLSQLMVSNVHELRSGAASTQRPAISEDCYQFLLRCFVEDPAERATMEQLLRHPWIVAGQPFSQPPAVLPDADQTEASLTALIDSLGLPPA